VIRVIVVDDHPIVRSGIVGLLEAEPGIEVVAQADSGEQALELVAELQPDVVLLDLRMPGIGGVETARRIAQEHEGIRVLIFTTYEDDDQILAAIEAGASGYLVKAAPAEELAAGIRGVASGHTVLAPSVAAQLARAIRSPKVALTPREHEILGLVAEGLSNPDIAAHLVIGESTVKTHLLNVFDKLEVSDRTRAVTRAMELGIL
jgi:DNA-binding NarL/FixJ family response regulator